VIQIRKSVAEVKIAAFCGVGREGGRIPSIVKKKGLG
jgi:hypothetical protein